MSDSSCYALGTVTVSEHTLYGSVGTESRIRLHPDKLKIVKPNNCSLLFVSGLDVLQMVNLSG